MMGLLASSAARTVLDAPISPTPNSTLLAEWISPNCWMSDGSARSRSRSSDVDSTAGASRLTQRAPSLLASSDEHNSGEKSALLPVEDPDNCTTVKPSIPSGG